MNTRLLLKIGLAISVSINFVWVTRQLSSLGANLSARASYDELLLAPEYDKDGRDLYAAPMTKGGSSAAAHASSPSSSPFDPRGKPLPSHPSPNAELQDLVGSNRPESEQDCGHDLVYVDDHVLPDSVTHPPGRLVPRLLHITAKSRCMTHAFANNINKWKNVLGGKYSIYIHDDDAVNKFIYQRRWVEFPELKEVLGCVTAGAAFADIWRYIMIWEYGGIYSDMDSIANKFSVDTIRPTDDAFFLVEMMGFPSQYWFAASPRHPIMYLSAKQALQTMAFRNDIADNKHLAKLTGPGATKVAIILFMQFAGVETNGYLKEGVYEGTHGRRVTVAGSKEMPNEWVIREMKTKKGNYAKMGMTHYHESRGIFNQQHKNQNIRCLDQRYKMHVDFTADWVNIV